MLSNTSLTTKRLRNVSEDGDFVFGKANGLALYTPCANGDFVFVNWPGKTFQNMCSPKQNGRYE